MVVMATDFSSKEITEKYSEGMVVELISLKPVILGVVGDVNGKTVLDLGCGDGKYSMVFAKSGAKVTGIDASEHQIRIAKDKNRHKNIEYFHQDATDISNIKNSSIDIVFMNMVIPDLDSREKLENIFLEVSRTLKPEGRVVLSTLHPLYLSPEQDSSDKPVDFKKERYFEEGHTYKAEALTCSGNKFPFNETHFSLTYLSEVFKKNNLVLCRIAENKPVPEKDIFLPKYIVFEMIKQNK